MSDSKSSPTKTCRTNYDNGKNWISLTAKVTNAIFIEYLSKMFLACEEPIVKIILKFNSLFEPQCWT